MMPGEDGLSVLRGCAATRGPAIIMLSAMGEDTDRIVGSRSAPTTTSRSPAIRANCSRGYARCLRRREGSGAAAASRRFGAWTLDLVARTVRRDGGDGAGLTDAEFRVLNAFLDRPQRVLTRDQLLEFAKGADADAFDRAIDVTISRLRRKLGADDPIRTVRGEGYQLDAKVTDT